MGKSSDEGETNCLGLEVDFGSLGFVVGRST